MIELRRPTAADKGLVLEMMAEFDQSHSAHDGGFWDKDDFNYDDWLLINFETEIGVNLPEGWVPSIQLVAFEEDRAIGFLSLRLMLNDYLYHQGGHIGYSVRPSERGKGYATLMLAKGLQLAGTKNLSKVLVTCSEKNPASRSVILKNGGILDDVRAGIERYWVEVVADD